MIGQIKTDNPIDYGAKTIGKIVISAAQYCNKIAALNTADSKELVNLILGRTEVAKAEILKILELEEDPEAARKLIEQEKNATEDYFNSVRAQIENF
jgi:DNA-directed RNA polymerase subunit F